MNRRDEIRRRLEEATPGPWDWMAREPGWPVCRLDPGPESPESETWWVLSQRTTFLRTCEDDARLIANAPADLAYLLDRLDKAERVVHEAEVMLHCYIDVRTDEPELRHEGLDDSAERLEHAFAEWDDA